MDKQPPIVVIKARTCLETAFAPVKLQECGLGVNIPVNVGFLCNMHTCAH